MDFSDSDALDHGKDAQLDGSESELSAAHRASADGDMNMLTHAIQTDPVLLECTDAEGYVPLAYAVMAEKLDSVKLLLKMGASVNRQDNMGRTCLAMAAYQGWHEGVVTLLRRGARQTICDKYSRLPLHCATYKSDTRVLRSLLQNLTMPEVNTQDNEGMTALHWSAFHDRPEHVRILLDKGADVFVQDIDGKTVLHWAAQNGCESCTRVLGCCYHGTDLVNQLDYSGKAASHFAAASGHAEVIHELAEVKGCDLEIEDPDERTPLHWATAAGQAYCVRTLLDLGIQPNPVDSEGGTPLDYARQSGCQECVRLIEERQGLQTEGGHLGACDVALRSQLPRARKNPFNFLLNLFKSRRTEKSLKAKFVHEEDTESEHFSSDSVFDDSNENNLTTTNLNIDDVLECPASQGVASSADRGCQNKNCTPEEVTSPPDGVVVKSNVCDTKRPRSKSESVSSAEDGALLSQNLNIRDLKRPQSRQRFEHRASEHHISTQNHLLLDSTQKLVISRTDNPRIRCHATSDCDTDDIVLPPGNRFESDYNRHLIRSPPPMLKYTDFHSRHLNITPRGDEKTDPVGGAMDKLSMHQNGVSPLTSHTPKNGSETRTRHSLPHLRTDGSVVQLAPIKGPVPPKQDSTTTAGRERQSHWPTGSIRLRAEGFLFSGLPSGQGRLIVRRQYSVDGMISSMLLDRRLEALRSERSGQDRPPTPPDWNISPRDRSASFPKSLAHVETLFPARSKKKRNRQLLLLKQSTSFDSVSDKDSSLQSSSSSSSTKSHDRKVGTKQLPADFYEQRHSMDKSIQHLLH